MGKGTRWLLFVPVSCTFRMSDLKKNAFRHPHHFLTHSPNDKLMQYPVIRTSWFSRRYIYLYTEQHPLYTQWKMLLFFCVYFTHESDQRNQSDSGYVGTSIKHRKNRKHDENFSRWQWLARVAITRMHCVCVCAIALRYHERAYVKT